MRKGESTRALIVARAAEVFNVQGVGGAAISDIMAATGLKKGGIYNHFASKEELALASFEHATAVLARRFAPVWEEQGVNVVRAFIETFRGYAQRPPLAGGCPVLNAAIDSDDTNPALRARAHAVAEEWQERLAAVLRGSQERGESRPEIDAVALASVIVASLEGALMLTKLSDDPQHLQWAADHLLDYLERAVCC